MTQLSYDEKMNLIASALLGSVAERLGETIEMLWKAYILEKPETILNGKTVLDMLRCYISGQFFV